MENYFFFNSFSGFVDEDVLKFLNSNILVPATKIPNKRHTGGLKKTTFSTTISVIEGHFLGDALNIKCL